MRRLSPLPGLVAVLFVAVAPASAVVTIGEDMSAPFSELAGHTCLDSSPANTVVTLASGAGLPVTAPTDGVLVRWRSRGNGPAQMVTARLRVVRPSGASYTGAGIGDLTPPFSAVSTFDSRLAIRAGDYIGLDLTCGAGELAVHHVVGSKMAEWAPALPEGGAASTPTQTDNDYDVMLDADIEPDADHDGYGDETQDGCPSQAITHGSCISTPPPVTDVQPPKARAFFKSHDGLHQVVSHGLRGVVKSNEAGSAVAVAFISGRAAHQLHITKLVRVARGKVTIASAGSWTIRLRFKKSYRHRLHKANRLAVKVRVVVKDKAGNATVVNRKVILKG